MKIVKNGDELLLVATDEHEAMALAQFLPGGAGAGHVVVGEPTATDGMPALAIKKYTGCAAKAIVTKQPSFTLLAQDKLAAPLVTLWANLAALHGCAQDKVDDARVKAMAMYAWPTRKFPD